MHGHIRATIRVTGAGTMGSGIAQACVTAGLSVVLVDKTKLRAAERTAAIAPVCRADRARAVGVDHDAARRGEAGRDGSGVQRDPRGVGRLDFVLHSIAFAPAAELHGRVADTSREAFARAMDISCHSFVRMAHLAEPLMDKGGALLTMSYLDAGEVVPHCGVMGPVKSELEASVRYLSTEMGPRGIRVNAVSPWRIATRAASGIPAFDALVAEARRCGGRWRSTTSAPCAPSS